MTVPNRNERTTGFPWPSEGPFWEPFRLLYKIFSVQNEIFLVRKINILIFHHILHLFVPGLDFVPGRVPGFFGFSYPIQHNSWLDFITFFDTPSRASPGEAYCGRRQTNLRKAAECPPRNPARKTPGFRVFGAWGTWGTMADDKKDRDIEHKVNKLTSDMTKVAAQILVMQRMGGFADSKTHSVRSTRIEERVEKLEAKVETLLAVAAHLSTMMEDHLRDRHDCDLVRDDAVDVTSWRRIRQQLRQLAEKLGLQSKPDADRSARPTVAAA